MKNEKYAHIDSCIEDLNNALQLLREIKQSERNSVVDAAFERALIEYSKPYKVSYGMEVDAKGKPITHKCCEWSIPFVLELPFIFIPPQHIELHKRIIDLRDKILAHSDLTVQQPTVFVTQSEDEKFALIGKNVIAFIATDEFQNIDDIIDLIEQSLNSMYEEQKNLKAALPSKEMWLVKIKHNAEQQNIEKDEPEKKLVVWLTSPPTEDKADRELTELLSKEFTVDKLQIAIKPGNSSTKKIIEMWR